MELVTYFWVQITLRKDSLDDNEKDYYISLCEEAMSKMDRYAISLIFLFSNSSSFCLQVHLACFLLHKFAAYTEVVFP